MKNIRAVIFDMDGVIIDSMPYHFLAWYEALRPYGVRVSCFDVYSKEGERWEKSLRYFLNRAGVSPTKRLLNKIFRIRQGIFRKYFKRYIFRGAEEVISSLSRKGYSLALVTGSPDDQIARILPKRIYDLFDHVVAGNRVKRGKPHPDPYQRAAKALKIRPGECVVIENAPYGIESAKRAGMYCVAISTSLPKEYLKKADLIIEDLSEVEGSLS